MNRFMASKVDCCVPVPNSPETCVKPLGLKPKNAAGMPPVALKKFVNALATFC